MNGIIKIHQDKIKKSFLNQEGYRYYTVNISTNFGNYSYILILNLLLEIPYIGFSSACTDSKTNIDIIWQYKELRDIILKHILTEDYDDYIEFDL